MNIASTTRENLAKEWQCSPRHIDRLIARKELTAFRLGRCIRIPLDSARAFQEKNQTTA